MFIYECWILSQFPGHPSSTDPKAAVRAGTYLGAEAGGHGRLPRQAELDEEVEELSRVVAPRAGRRRAHGPGWSSGGAQCTHGCTRGRAFDERGVQFGAL